MLSKMSLSAIQFYQKFISPKKGFRCAYGVLNNTHGCSGSVKAIIESKGLINGFSDIKGQFSACKQASEELKQRKKKKKNDEGGVCLEPCTCSAADCAIPSPGKLDACDCLDAASCIP